MLVKKPTKVTRPNKLYFEAKKIDNKVRFRWVLKSPQGREIAVSHVTFGTKGSVVKNCVAVFGLETLLDGKRMTVVDPEMFHKVQAEFVASTK